MLRQLGLAALLMFLAAGCPLGGEPAAPPPPGGDGPAKGASEKPPPGAAASAASSWKGWPPDIQIEGVPELSGRGTAGLILLPPAYKVKIKGLTAFKISFDADWAKAGGTHRKLKDGTCELFTPQLPAGYQMRISRAGVDRRVPIVILHEAEITRNKKTGAWLVKLGKQTIGTYPNPEKAKSWRVRMHQDLFKPPRFWMKITPKNEKLLLAPHVTVGQMVGYITTKDKKKPKRRHISWFPPNRHFIYKMEMLSRELLARKVKFKRLAVNSAFRTPYYNRRVGGGSFSRHIYGDAADVMIDENDDEVCDDITGDGEVDEKDGLVLGQALRKLEAAKLVRVGGAGVYAFDGPKSCRSYAHFDSRGYLTRWGTLRKRGKRRAFEWWPPAEYNEDQEPPPEFREPPGKKGEKARK